MVTYCASRLPPELLAAAEVLLVTCESDPAEVEALSRRCASCQHVDVTRWRTMLGHLRLGQAIALPITEEAGGEPRLFTIGARLTPHVRHREKYVDVPVTEPRAFVVSGDVRHASRRARTLREFVETLERLPLADVGGYLRRGDFSRWIGDVFGDHALADDLRALEEQYRRADGAEELPEIAAAIRARYDLTNSDAPDQPLVPAMPVAAAAVRERVA